MESTIYDANFRIALTLPYPDIISLCNTNRIFNLICNNEFFWSEKLKRDFPLELKLNNLITYKQAYIIARNEKFEMFKFTMRMEELSKYDIDDLIDIIDEDTGVISLYKDKISYSYMIRDDLGFMLKEDLFIATKGLFNETESLEFDYIMVETEGSNEDINLLVKQGNFTGINEDDLRDLNLDEYRYVILGSYYQPSENDIMEWTILGFIYRI